MNQIKKLEFFVLDEDQWAAFAFGGHYEITRHDEVYGIKWCFGRQFKWLSCGLKKLPSIEDCKKLAQEDFEAAVNKCLVN